MYMTPHKRMVSRFLFVCLLSFVRPPVSAYAIDPEYFALMLSRVPSLFQTYITRPDSARVVAIKNATCFPMQVKLQTGKTFLFFIANYHALTLRDASDRIVAETDTGEVFRNAKDTVVTLRVRLLKKNPALDLVLLEDIDKILTTSTVDTIGISIDLDQVREPKVGEEILYSGFPLLLGEDPALKQNHPLVINGLVSQVIPGNADFIVQAPIFSGASGSPILSKKNGEFLGIIYASVPRQESFLYGVKGSTICAWIKQVLLEKDSSKSSQKKQ